MAEARISCARQHGDGAIQCRSVSGSAWRARGERIGRARLAWRKTVSQGRRRSGRSWSLWQEAYADEGDDEDDLIEGGRRVSESSVRAIHRDLLDQRLGAQKRTPLSGGSVSPHSIPGIMSFAV